MSYSTTVMIPGLYDAANTIDEMSKKFGTTIRYDNPDGNPSKANIKRYLNKLGDALFRFNTNAFSVHKLNKQKKRMNKSYFVIFMLLLYVGGVPLFLLFGWDFIKKHKDVGKYMLEWLIAFLVSGIILYLFVFFTRYAIKVKGRSYILANNLYNSQVFDTTKQIIELKNMMNIKTFIEPGKTKSYSVDSSFPALIYSFFKSRNLPVNKGKSNIGNADCLEKLCQKNSVSFDEALPSCSGDGYVYPFRPSSGLSVVELKKELAAYDLYGQIRRLRDAIAYFKAILTKAGDMGVGSSMVLTVEAKEFILRKVIDIILSGFTIVDDIKLTSHHDWILTTSSSECHKSCLNDLTCILSTFDKTNNVCRSFTKDSLKSQRFSYEPNSDNTLIKKVDGIMSIEAKRANESLVDTTMCKDSNGCLEKFNMTDEVITYEQTVKGENVDYSSVLDSGKGSPDLTGKLYSFTLTTSPSVIVTNKQKENFGDSIRSLKDYYMSLIVKTIVENDPTMTFSFTDEMLQRIIDQVSSKLGVDSNVYENTIRDLMLEVPNILQTTFNEKRKSADGDAVLTKYVSYDRFVDKMSTMSKEEFITKFIYNLEEIRATSAGITHLNNSFNISDTLHSLKNEMTDLTMTSVIVVGTLVVLIVLVQQILSYKKNPPAAKTVIAKWSNIMNIVIKVTVVAAFVVVIWSMIYASKNKRDTKYLYNKQVLEKNGMIITNDAVGLLDNVYTGVVLTDRYKSRALPASVAQTPTPEQMFETLVKVSEKSKTMMVSFSSVDPNNYELYLSMINVIEAFDKCNSLVAASLSDYPFPVLDVTTYSIIIIVALIALAVILGQMQPISHLREIKKFNLLKSRINKSMVVDKNDIGCFDTSQEMDEQLVLTLKLVGVALLIMFTIAFSQSLQTNSEMFAAGLFSSNLFANSECFNL